MTGLYEALIILKYGVVIYVLARIAYHFSKRGLTYQNTAAVMWFLEICAWIRILWLWRGGRGGNLEPALSLHPFSHWELAAYCILMAREIPGLFTTGGFTRYLYKKQKGLFFFPLRACFPLALFIPLCLDYESYYFWCGLLSLIALPGAGTFARMSLIWLAISPMFLFDWDENKLASYDAEGDGTPLFSFSMEDGIAVSEEEVGTGKTNENNADGDEEERADVDGDTLDGYFKKLGLKPGASSDEIRHAYRELVKQYHPDKVAHLGAKLQKLATKEMRDLNDAYEKLQSSM